MGAVTIKIKHQRKCFSAFLIILACCLVSLQSVHADETMPQNLQSWDIEMGMHTSHSFDLTQSVYSHYSEDYEPLVMTLHDFRTVYKVLSGESIDPEIFSFAEPLIVPMHYNFEVDSNGGVRFDLRYLF